MKEENNSKNYVIFFISTVLILMGYDSFFGKSKESIPYKVEKVNVQNQIGQVSGRNISSQPDKITDNEDKIPERLVKISSKSLSGNISNKGAIIKNIVLKKYNENQDKDSSKVTLINKSYFIESSWISNGNNLKLPTRNSVWKIEGNEELTPNTPITMTWDNGEGIIFKKTYSLDENYLLNVSQKIINNTNQTIKLQSHIKCFRDISGEEKDKYWSFYAGPIGVFDKKLEEVGYDKIDEKKSLTFEGKGGWCGITDKYWLIAIIPNQNNHIAVNYSKSNDNLYNVDMSSDDTTIESGCEVSIDNNIFIGAKEIKVLDMYEEKLGVKNLDLAIDFGYLYLITKPMLYALSYLQDIVGNMGLCILILTVILKLLLFPLANKSYKSMNRLREFQPRIKALQDRYKDDRVKLGQEISALYKREKINPVGGCLPALLQSPVLFALYKVLYISIDMRQAPFYGWIHDLSLPDSAYIMNLFGLIPVNLPGFLQIGIWPILMGLSMLVQQKLAPQVGDQTQAKIMTIVMPLMFIFMFASLPSGLVIYWTWSNLLGILQQYAIMRLDSKAKTI